MAERMHDYALNFVVASTFRVEFFVLVPFPELPDGHRNGLRSKPERNAGSTTAVDSAASCCGYKTASSF